MSSLQNLEDWLIKITEHTRATREAMQAQRESGGAGPKNESREQTFLDTLGKRLEGALSGAVAAKLGQAQSLANRGFSGTVEQARHDHAMEQLSRQFAAVMKPLLDGATYLAVQVERRMRAMGGAEQNRMMGAIIGAGIGMRLGGIGGALAGGALGAGAMGPNSEMSGWTRAAMVASGAYAGFQLGGPVGAVAGGGAAAAATSLDYDRLRFKEKSRVGAGLASIAMGFYDLSPAGAMDIFGLNKGRAAVDAEMAKKKAETAEPKPRTVTPFQSEMGEAGSTAMRIQQAMIRTTAGDGHEEDGGPFKPLIDIGLAIFDQLIRMSGGTPSPRSVREET